MQAKMSPTTFGSPLTTEMIACLEACFQDLEAGQSERWNADPYFSRGDGLASPTVEDADRLIAALDEEFDSEINQFPAFHIRRSGATAGARWYRLPESARLGLAQRLCAIADKYP